jgi:formylglycine-generating enzyme required for sulfatase activity
MAFTMLLIVMAFASGRKKTEEPNDNGNGGGDTPGQGGGFEAPDVWTLDVNGVRIEMIKVQGGTFWMGAQNTDQNGQNYDEQAGDLESPVHQVILSDYYIGKYEVSQELWRAVMGTNPSHFEGDYLPIENVGINAIKDFLFSLNAILSEKIGDYQFRLPTEAQWEYAAKGGKSSQSYRYSGSNNSILVAWYSQNSDNQTHPIGSKEPNELFLYDMSGNVAEWCNDYAGGYVGALQTDPIGPSLQFVGDNVGYIVRGGSWKRGSNDCRSSSRDARDTGEPYIGFRLVLSKSVGQASVPGLLTYEANSITTNSVCISGALMSDGGSYPSEWGYYYGTSSDLAANGICFPVSEPSYYFRDTLINLLDNTKYYVCAYAKNEIGIGYGNVVEFTTFENIPTTISISNGAGYANENTQIFSGDEVIVGFVATGWRLTKLEVAITQNNAVLATHFVTIENQTNYTYSHPFTINAQGVVNISGTVTDAYGQTATVSFNIFCTEKPNTKFIGHYEGNALATGKTEINLSGMEPMQEEFINREIPVILDLTEGENILEVIGTYKISNGDLMECKGTVDGDIIIFETIHDCITINYDLNGFTITPLVYVTCNVMGTLNSEVLLLEGTYVGDGETHLFIYNGTAAIEGTIGGGLTKMR